MIHYDGRSEVAKYGYNIEKSIVIFWQRFEQKQNKKV